jgi:hypothetical protein
MDDKELFPEIPVFVIHDTVISDILGGKESTKYRDSASFITNYFLIRQAVIGMDSGKSGITTTQVFEEFKKTFQESNTFRMIQDWIDEETFTENLDTVNIRSSVYVLCHFIARRNLARTGRRVILVCNDEKIGEKLLTFYKNSGFDFKYIEDLSFAVMNTDELKNWLKDIDKRFYKFFSDKI